MSIVIPFSDSEMCEKWIDQQCDFYNTQYPQTTYPDNGCNPKVLGSHLPLFHL